MSWETTDVLSADTTDVLSAATTDVLPAMGGLPIRLLWGVFPFDFPFDVPFDLAGVLWPPPKSNGNIGTELHST